VGATPFFLLIILILSPLAYSRKKNNVAHELAHFAIRSDHSEVFLVSFPDFVLCQVCNDTT